MTITCRYQSDFARRHYFAGFAEGYAETIAESIAKGITEAKSDHAALVTLAALEARHVDVPDDARSKILSCVNLPQLEIWLRRAATAESITDLFE
jgi:hypothetical protein